MDHIGTPHGKQSIFRWDASTAASVMVVGALLFLLFIHFNFRASAGGGFSPSRHHLPQRR